MNRSMVDFCLPFVDEVEWAKTDKDKLYRLIQYCNSSAMGQCFVVWDERQVVGICAVSAEELPWSQKRYACIHLIFGLKSDTIKILASEIISWFESKRNILAIQYSFPVKQDNVISVLEDLGFLWEGSVFMRRRYNGLSKQNIQAG